MPQKPLKVLFLCTGNSARSLMAEAILTQMAPERFKAYSAGSQPKSAPNPYTIDLLKARGHDVRSVRSKSWDEFTGPAAPDLDIVITVCDSAAAEICPIWPGAPVRANWSMPDPDATEGNEAEKRAAFAKAYQTLRERIQTLDSAPMAALDRAALQERLNALARG